MGRGGLAAPATRRRHSERARSDRTPLAVLLGRATLALIPTLWIAAFVTRPIWIDAPVVDGYPHHPLTDAFMGLSLVIGFVSPWLLLPYGTVADARLGPDGTLTVVTVLGERQIDLERLERIGALTVRGRGGETFLVFLRSSRLRWALVSLGSTPHVPAAIHQRLLRAAAERPRIVSARARAMLRIGERPGLAQRFALGVITSAVGFAVFGCWALLAGALIAMACMPLG